MRTTVPSPLAVTSTPLLMAAIASASAAAAATLADAAGEKDDAALLHQCSAATPSTVSVATLRALHRQLQRRHVDAPTTLLPGSTTPLLDALRGSSIHTVAHVEPPMTPVSLSAQYFILCHCMTRYYTYNVFYI